MNNTQWLQGMHHLDTKTPATDVTGERMYTLYMRDLMKMPTLDFGTLTQIDEAVRSLLN